MVSRFLSLTDFCLKPEHVLANWSEAEDKLYNDLSSTISEVPEQDPIFILGDFNARVGADQKSWSSCMLQFRIRKLEMKMVSVFLSSAAQQSLHH